MVKVGDLVSYGTQGVCRVKEFTEKLFYGDVMEYVVLAPLYDESATIFIPVKNQKLMDGIHHLLSVEEVDSIVEAVSKEEELWIADDNLRKAKYREILAANDHREILKMMRLVHEKKISRQEKGKKLHVCDERFLKEAEKLILDEFSLVLHMRRDRILPYIFEGVQQA